MCELRWLKDEDLVEAREFSTYGEAQRDLDQLCPFYRKRPRASAPTWRR